MSMGVDCYVLAMQLTSSDVLFTWAPRRGDDAGPASIGSCRGLPDRSDVGVSDGGTIIEQHWATVVFVFFFRGGGGPSPSQSEHADSSGCMTEVIWTRRGLIGRYGGGQQHSSLQMCAQTQLRLIAGHAQLGKSVCGWLEQGGWGWISERQQQHVLVTGDGRR